MPTFWYILDFMEEIGCVSFDNLLNAGVIIFFSFPTDTMVFGQSGWFDFGYLYCLDVIEISGSLKRIAVASTILGMRNVPASDDEKTDNTVAPDKPDERKLTSERTNEF